MRLQLPAPPDAFSFHALEVLCRIKLEAVRIAVVQAHDAFARADQLAYPAVPEHPVVVLLRVDVDQVVGKGHGPVPVEIGEETGLGDAVQVAVVLDAADPVHEDEELVRVAGAFQAAVLREIAGVDGADVPGQDVERHVRPEHLGGTVGEGIVAEPLLYPHGREDDRLCLTFQDEIDDVRLAVAEALQLGLAGLGTESCDANDFDGLPVHIA